MAKMRRLAPRIKALQETYKDDRQALSQKHDGALQTREGQSGGRLPADRDSDAVLLLVLLGAVESVEMRQAPFMLWINDLSARDPYFVLPLLMGVAMFIQIALEPAAAGPDAGARHADHADRVQRHVHAVLPAGLVLYWLTNTLLSILQQWRINTVVARENAAAG